MNNVPRLRVLIATRFLAAAALSFAAIDVSLAYDVVWNDGTASFTGSQTWSYNDGGTLQTTDNPFLLPDAPANGGGENIVFIGNGGDVTLNSSHMGGTTNGLFGLRVGTLAAEADLTGIGGGDFRGDGTLTVTGNHPLVIHDFNQDIEPWGHMFIGHLGAEGTVNWNSTNMLTVRGRLRIGEVGTGTLNQSSGVVAAGQFAGGARFMTIGNLGGTGTYNLNDGKLEVGNMANPRLLWVAVDPNSTGTFNIGDGVGSPDTAHFETWGAVEVNKFGGGSASGQLNLHSDGFLDVKAQTGLYSPVIIGGANGATGVFHQEGGRFLGLGLLRIGADLGRGTYESVGSAGSSTARALRMGSNGSLNFTLDAAGARTLVLEGTLNSDTDDPATGIILLGNAQLGVNGLSAYTSNSDLVLVDSQDAGAGRTGVFANLTQGQSLGTNANAVEFFLNYNGGDSNDIVLQSVRPGSFTDGLVWNTGSANFSAGWAQGDGNYGVDASGVNPFSSGQHLFLGNNGTANLSSSGTVQSLRIGTNQAEGRIDGTNGDGTLTASGSTNLTIGDGAVQADGSETGDLYVGSGGFTGTVNWNSSGTLEVEGKLRVGSAGTGVLNQTDGLVTAGTTGGALKYMAVGEGTGGDGTYNLDNGTLRPGDGTPEGRRLLRVGAADGTGTFVLGDGIGAAGSARIETEDDINVGDAGGTGTLTINADGEVDMLGGVESPFQVGVNGGNGTVIQNGGTVTAGDKIVVGDVGSAVGEYTLNDGSLSGQFLFIGANTGTGNFVQQNGTVTVNVNMSLGDFGSGDGSYTMHAGSLDVGARFHVGISNGGEGTFMQNGGNITAGTFGTVGDLGATGEYTMNGGSLAIAEWFSVGINNGTGTFVQNAGDVSTGLHFTVGDLFPGATGNYTLGSGTLGVGTNFHVGLNAGTGTFTQEGGAVTVGGFASIGDFNGAVGTYTMTGGSLNLDADAGDPDGGADHFRVGGNSGTGTFRLEGDAMVTNETGDLFIAWLPDTGATGRLELAGSQASFRVGRLENEPGDSDETIRFEADASGVTPLVVTGTSAFDGAMNFVQLQDPDEVLANTGAPGSLMGNGIKLELDLSAILSSTTLTLIDNLSAEPIIGFFEDPLAAMDLYEENEEITGTGFNGMVNISYLGGDGNDVVLNLVSAGLTGDFNNDGFVDAADYVVWRANDGTQAGYDAWVDNFGTAVPGSGSSLADAPLASAVPEPATIAMTIAGLIGALSIRRRR